MFESDPLLKRMKEAKGLKNLRITFKREFVNFLLFLDLTEAEGSVHQKMNCSFISLIIVFRGDQCISRGSYIYISYHIYHIKDVIKSTK
jgi:hypothetical protein